MALFCLQMKSWCLFLSLRMICTELSINSWWINTRRSGRILHSPSTGHEEELHPDERIASRTETSASFHSSRRTEIIWRHGGRECENRRERRQKESQNHQISGSQLVLLNKKQHHLLCKSNKNIFKIKLWNALIGYIDALTKIFRSNIRSRYLDLCISIAYTIFIHLDYII